MTALAVTPTTPSSSLPLLKHLSSHSPALLALSIRSLSLLYHPSSLVHDSGYASATASSKLTPEDEEEWTRLRADDYERACALRWLTGLIARSEEWLGDGYEEEEEGEERVREDKEKVLEDAAALLAACSRTSEAGALRREYRFPVGGEEGRTVSVWTRDESYTGEDHAAVGVQTWASSILLAELIAASPSSFNLPFPSPPSHPPQEPFRILELGAGTGLLSLLLAALSFLYSSSTPTPTQPISILATDFHPSVLSNLASNILSNFPSQPPHLSLSSRFLDWSAPPPLDPFDLIVGADLIYEPAHCALLHTAVSRLLKRGGAFHLIMPVRPTHAVETKLVREVFPFAQSGRERGDGREVLAVTEVREMERAVGKGRADEVRYEIFRMEWV